MWGRCLQGEREPSVRLHSSGRTDHNLSPASVARLATETVKKGGEEEEARGSPESLRRLSLDSSRSVDGAEAPRHGMKNHQVPDCPPGPSRPSRKSVNWAPAFNPAKKATIKRTSSRLTPGPSTSSAENERNAVEQTSTKDELLGKAFERMISYKSRQCKEKQPASPAAEVGEASASAAEVTEAPEERTSQPTATSDFARASVGEESGPGDGGPLDGNHAEGSQGARCWVSVPLTDMETGDNSRRKSRRVGEAVPLPETKAEKNYRRKSQRVSAAANQSSDKESSQSAGDGTDTEAATISEMCAKLLSEISAEVNDTSKLRKLQGMVIGLKDAVQQVEYTMLRNLQEKKAACACAAKATAAKATVAAAKASVAAKSKKLRDEIAKLKKSNQKVVTEKLRIQRERDQLKKENLSVRRLQVDVEKAKAHAAAMSSELTKEQDKNCCQICFSVPRDTIVLPCMHFYYCIGCLQKHQQRIKECPTCRGKISGVLRCNISTT